MGEHFVVIYVDKGSRQFTITARMQRSDLACVDKWAVQRGYRRIELARGLDKTQAESLRDRTRAEYEGRGYTYQTRT